MTKLTLNTHVNIEELQVKKELEEQQKFAKQVGLEEKKSSPPPTDNKKLKGKHARKERKIGEWVTAVRMVKNEEYLKSIYALGLMFNGTIYEEWAEDFKKDLIDFLNKETPLKIEGDVPVPILAGAINLYYTHYMQKAIESVLVYKLEGETYANKEEYFDAIKNHKELVKHIKEGE